MASVHTKVKKYGKRFYKKYINAEKQSWVWVKFYNGLT